MLDYVALVVRLEGISHLLPSLIFFAFFQFLEPLFPLLVAWRLLAVLTLLSPLLALLISTWVCASFVMATGKQIVDADIQILTKSRFEPFRQFNPPAFTITNQQFTATGSATFRVTINPELTLGQAMQA